VKDGEPDFSKYTPEQIERSLARVDREKYPLNYANLLAAQRALPPSGLEAAANNSFARGEVWLSAPLTLIMNTVGAAGCAIAALWLARKFALDPAVFFVNGESDQLPVLVREALALVMIAALALGAIAFPRIRRVVMRDGQLEVLGLFGRDQIGLYDIERVRWDDQRERGRNKMAEIVLRTPCRFGSRLRMWPRSLAVIRAFAAYVATIQNRPGVADPNYGRLRSRAN
jgi:hypothetical protein